jgi:hypothetical protein
MVRILLAVLLFVGAACGTGPDLDALLARWKRVPMPFQAEGLSAQERQVVAKLVEASRYIEDIYWRQTDPEGLRLLADPATDPKLRRLLMINGSRFDLVDGNRPFAGTDAFSPGAALYPRGLTQADVERYVEAHPRMRAGIYSPTSIVFARGPELGSIPYREAFRQFLEPAARALLDAAALSPDAAFARFLRLRAAALTSDDYYASDVAWLDLQDPKIDLICAPYETYIDGVLGVKGSYGAAVLIRDDAASRRVAAFAKFVPALQDSLPLAVLDRPSKTGHASPMEVVNAPFRAGDLRHGYQAVADNLPNDPRIHAEKGSKKMFFENFLNARVDNIVVPLAGRLMAAPDAALVNREAYLTDTVLHEISHGLGPVYARQQGRRVDINEALGPVYGPLEEAKADVVGMLAMDWLGAHGGLTAAQVRSGGAAHVADLFRMLRFGTAEAHAVSEIMQFSYFVREKAIVWDAGARRYAIDFARLPGAVARLAKELLEIEATGDAARAERWLAEYRDLPPELDGALKTARDLPVDMDPVFSFPDEPR